jgi:CMP-N-acetylneuraminic acid synthetase
MVLGVIPARGGSKGIPGKNILPFCGRPLIDWSIAAAEQSQLIDRFVVSTEDLEIAEVAQTASAEVLPRPVGLATDDATTLAVLMHVLEHIPTCPIRVNNLVDRAIQRFLDSEADSLATGYILKDIEWGTHNNLPRQQIEGFFYDDGNVYVHRAEVLRQGRWYGENLERMIVEHHYSFDIDDEVDFSAAEAVMNKLI